MVEVEVKRKAPSGQDAPPPPEPPIFGNGPRGSSPGDGCGFIILRWLVYALVIWALAQLLPGIEVDGYRGAMGVTLVLSILNVLVKPFLYLFALVIGIKMRVTRLGLGLMLLVCNAVVISLVDLLMDSLTIEHFGWSLAMAAIISAVSAWTSGTTRPPNRPPA